MVNLDELRKSKVGDEVYVCAQCGYCNSVCPICEQITWESASPRGKLYFIKRMLSNSLLGPKTDLNSEFANRMFQCTMCGLCKEVCQTTIETFQLWQATRSELFKSGMWPQELKELSSALESTGNIYLRPRERIWAATTDDRIKHMIKKKGTEIAYFTGCVFDYMRRFSSIPESLTSIFNELDLTCTFLGPDELCCGNPLFLTGEHQLAEKLARHNVKSIQELGVKKLVLTCAGCYRAFTKEYPKIIGDELPFEVFHSSQLLAQLLDEGKLKFSGESSYNGKLMTYQDPCELGRHCGVYEEPRKILENIPGLKYVELPKTRNKCVCCGGGGMLKVTNPELSLKIASKKLDEVKSVGANIIVTGCAACTLNISEAKAKFGAKTDVLDIVEIVANAMGVGERNNRSSK